MNRPITHRTKGFALIEVLIAVVVLAFGLLALAALQSALIKSSSESKAQSVALSLAKDKLDELRAYQGMDGYQGISDEATVAVDGDLVVAGTQAIGGVSYTRTVTVQRFVQAGGSFSLNGTDNGAIDDNRNEFKRVEVQVNWTDANNVGQSIVVEDALAALDPSDSAKLGKASSGTGPRPAKVLIVNPGSVDGVIPIALGGSDATAATNPKPIIEGAKSGSAKFIETRFDVLTYSALNDRFSQAQARVETVVVGCTCQRNAGSVSGFRPTFWDGTRYVPPEQKSYTGYGASTDASQSPYCTVCCRDHQDPAGTLPKARFSPYRATDSTPAGHTHEFLNADKQWEAVAAGGTYRESCRLIRVDGILDVAADPYNESYNIVPTGRGASSEGTVATPSSTGEASYQAFVLGYLADRYAQAPPSSDALAKTKYNTRWTPDPRTFANTEGLNLPDSIALKAEDIRWLHARGLYVDHLESAARSAVDRAYNSCKGTGTSPPTAAQRRNCVLRVLPFTSINLTEIAEWNERLKVGDTASRISVQNVTFSGAIDGDKGVVQPRANASDGSAWGWTVVGDSASGLTGEYPWAINGYEDGLFASASDATVDPNVFGTVLSDAMEYTLSAGGSGSTEQFYVAFDGGYAHNNEFVDSSLPATCSFASGKFECKPTGSAVLGVTVPISVSQYNYDASVLKANPCQANKTASMDYWVLHDVVTNGVKTSGAGAVSYQEVGTDLNESLEIKVDPIANGETVTVTFGTPTYKCPSTYTCGGKGSNTVIYDYTTMVACPNPAP